MNSNGGGRSQFYTLPLLLPAEFKLSVEIQGSPSALRRMRLLGLSLSTTQKAGEQAEIHPGLPGATEAWHPVEISLQAGRLQLTVDGKTRLLDEHSETLSEWLTVEPAPDETVTLRNLTVTW